MPTTINRVKIAVLAYFLFTIGCFALIQSMVDNLGGSEVVALGASIVALGGIIDKAADVYRPKSCLEKFKPHYQAANTGSYVFQFLAIVCAFAWGQNLFLGILPDFGATSFYLSCGFALLALDSIEGAKRLFFGDFIKSLSMGEGVAVLPLLGNILLIVLAVHTGTKGAELLALKQVDK